MDKKLFIILLFTIALVTGNTFAKTTDSTGREVYVINYSWHTGLVFEVTEQTIDLVTALKNFENFDYVDIGWGDEDFYQHPDTNYYLAAKAILYPTPSVLRVAGFKGSIESAANWSEFFIKFELENSEFEQLCGFIENSFAKTENNKNIISLKKGKDQIIFYKSDLYYHLLNTCNTWIAKALKAAGLEVSTGFVTTEEDLFERLKDKGRVIVPEE